MLVTQRLTPFGKNIPEFGALATRFLRELNYRGIAEYELGYIVISGAFLSWQGLGGLAFLHTLSSCC